MSSLFSALRPATSSNPYHTHIIVELSSGKRSSSTSFPFFQTNFVRLRRGFRAAKYQGEESGFRWLKELHSKIWGRDDLIPTLFKRVEVTRANYDQLQDILNRKYKGRDDANYNGNHNVLSDKLGFLWSLPAAKSLSPSHPDNTEAGDEDDDMEARYKDDDMEAGHEDDDVDVEPRDEDDYMDSSLDDDYEIDSFFPLSFKFLDLSTLKLTTMFNRCTFPLLLRKEYDHITRLIDECPRDGSGSIILSGQPGTGELLVSSTHRL